MTRACTAITDQGERCRQPPLKGETLCFWHHPEHRDAAAEARRLGGLRRKREKAIEGAYDVDGLESVPQIRRVLLIAILDSLGLDNSVPRNRALISSVLAAAKLLEVGELEARLEAVEAALNPRLPTPALRRAR
jgi:hypothetical protein